ncbi:hypothetical protein Sjap_004007 [Stephania japonica]|uniref:Uncharacterized protein n=1 Tax=Stephania japonica TaxID=461633 RepID=A0AAP0K2C6_9MAGN
MALLILFFQQLIGINVIMFYAPVLFQTLGFEKDASLMSSGPSQAIEPTGAAARSGGSGASGTDSMKKELKNKIVDTVAGAVRLC